MSSKFRLNNKTALITGGGSGIGKAIALTFAQQNANVHIIDFNIEAAQNSVRELNHQGYKAVAHHCDVSDYNQVLEIVQNIAKSTSIDI